MRGAKAADRLLGLEEEEAEGKLLWESRGEDDHVPAAGCEACDGYFEAVNGSYIDDVTGLPLPAEMVQTGRRGELEGFAKRTVYEVRSRAWAEAQGYPIFGTRWVDRMKGGKVRSRLCVQEFNTKKGKMGPDELFAPTPPLVAARYAVSRSASSMGMPRSMRRRLMAIDFEKAFLNGRMARHVCVRLPPEDAGAQGGTNVGYLNRAMYGLRDAPVIWQEVVANLMFERNFTAIRTMPCVYFNAEKDIFIVAHVDDFLAVESRDRLYELKTELASRYDCEGEVLGIDEGESAEIKFLGRRIAYTDTGLEWRGDPKQVRAYIAKAGLADSKGVDSPGVRRDKSEVEARAEPMEEKAATEHRSLVALGNYVAQDRPDIGFATLDLSTTMSKPMKGDEVGAKRLGRYFERFPECVLKYRWQSEPSGVVGYSDSDWASCTVTRRSVSGGALVAWRSLG